MQHHDPALVARVSVTTTVVVLLLVMLVAMLAAANTALSVPFEWGKHWFGISSSAPNVLRLAPYSLQMLLRLFWWLIAIAVVSRYDNQVVSWLRLTGSQQFNFLKGLALGFAVMCGVILMIVLLGDAQLSFLSGSLISHAVLALGWLLSELLGAAGEELLYRGLILLLVMRLAGPRVAIVVSALAFAGGHLANPGVSVIWICRLFAAGLLLGYSVIRSGSLWWAVGYHTGWNFASAPLFGATGSGFRDDGSAFQFVPSGSDLVTGGPVGPEGSLFALVAVAIATTVMLKSVRPRAEA